MTTKDEEQYDTLIQRLIEKADFKEKEIGKISNYKYKTNMSFPWGEERLDCYVNLNTIRTTEEVVRLFAFLYQKYDYWRAALDKLGMKSPRFQWGGFTFDQWSSDMKNRIAVIEIQTKKNELKSIRAQLDELMSPEFKRGLKLKELEARLNAEE